MVFLAAAAFALTLLWAAQRRLMYLPFGPAPAPADAGLPSAETFTVSTADGLMLGAWFLPADGTASATLIFERNAGPQLVEAVQWAAAEASAHR